MVIKAIYENGVFKPLEKVPLKEGTQADVYPRTELEGEKPKRSFLDTEAYGIWEDRTDIGNSVDYVNRLRTSRRRPSE